MMTSIGNGREKDEAKQLVADFEPERLVRLTDNAGAACSGMKSGRTSGIGSMLSADKVETAQAGMPSDQPIGLLSRGISTDEEPAIGVCGYQCGAVLSVPGRRNRETAEGKTAERCLMDEVARRFSHEWTSI